MRRGVIYTITHRASGKTYVGRTVRRNPRLRWTEHVHGALKRGVDTHLARAIRLYGKGAFDFVVVALADEPDLNDAERDWVAMLDTYRAGYNMSTGGDGGQNSRTPEVRRKISRSKTGVKRGPLSAATKEKIAATKRGKRRSPETIAKMSASRKGIKFSAEGRRKLSESQRRRATYVLSKQQVRDVADLSENHSDAVLAERYGVSRKMIWRIRNGHHPLLDTA